jgi:H+/Na+-translocating ferredoxin:NAD+ oxidoreductase subunit B
MLMSIIVITCATMGAIAFIAGIVLFIASKKFAVVENPLIDDVEEILPGANCGGCGFAGCRAFAEAAVSNWTDDLNCPVAGSETMAAIAKLLGLEVSETVRKTARVMCQGGGGNSVRSGEYFGIQTCFAAVVSNSVDLVCPYGCLGYGDCVRVCPFNCIHIVDGVAVVNEELCTGCGLCIKACPRNIIELTLYDKSVFVACMSPDKGAQVKPYCSVGCIGCKLCVKACEYDAFDYKPFLSHVNPEKCTECMACIEKCPTNSILVRNSDHTMSTVSGDALHENVSA